MGDLEHKHAGGRPVCSEEDCAAPSTVTFEDSDGHVWPMCHDHRRERWAVSVGIRRRSDPLAAGIAAAAGVEPYTSCRLCHYPIHNAGVSCSAGCAADDGRGVVPSLTEQYRRMTPDERAKLAEMVTRGEAVSPAAAKSPAAALRRQAAQEREAKSPRCFDCGGLHGAGDCVLPKITLAAERAAGALTNAEQIALIWLARMEAAGEDGAALATLARPPHNGIGLSTVAAIAGLFARAATRIEALVACAEIAARTPWWITIAEPENMIRCRSCGGTWRRFDVEKYNESDDDHTMPARCPALACKFGGGEVTS